jgi:hypothetical protein
MRHARGKKAEAAVTGGFRNQESRRESKQEIKRDPNKAKQEAKMGAGVT